MSLQDGDDVTFALPGHAGTLYTFARSGSHIGITSVPAAPDTTS